jgi:hypothetical protein
MVSQHNTLEMNDVIGQQTNIFEFIYLGSVMLCVAHIFTQV